MNNQHLNPPARRVLRRAPGTTPSSEGPPSTGRGPLRRWSVAELILEATRGLPAAPRTRNA
jgi:hypothetical protein